MIENNNIEQDMIDNRIGRQLQHGPGMELQKQVQSRNDMEDTDASQKFYKRKGTSTLGGFNELQMYRDGVDPQTREDGSYVVPNQYMLPGKVSMFGYDPVNGDKINDPVNEGSGWGIPLRVVGGAFHDIARGTVGLGLDVAEAAGVDTGVARRNFESYQEPEWLTKSAGWGEDIARDMAQYGTGYGGVLKGLGGMGIKSILGKNIAASVVAGQIFDPEEGNLGTLLNDFGMLPETMRYLDSKMTSEEHGRFMGRMSMALEEIGIGGGFGTAAKIVKQIGSRYMAHGDELVKRGVMLYNKSTGSLNHPTLGAQGAEVMSTDGASNAVQMVASGMRMKGASVDQFMRQAEAAGIDKNLAQKAWNNSAKEKLDRVAEFIAQPGPGPMGRQQGKISLFEGGTVSDVAKPADFESVQKYFDKQITRGNLQRAEYDDAIKPTIKKFKDAGYGSASPEQVMAFSKGSRSEFKTITKTDDAKFEQYIHRPTDNTLVLDYKEHLFTARNDNLEGAEGYVNEVHFSEPFVKGIARTSLMGKSAGPGELKNSKIFIQEMQSDAANAARQWGVWTDKDIEDKLVGKMREWDGDTAIIPELESMLGKPKTEQQMRQIDQFAEYLENQIATGSRIDLEHIRPHLATPSAFNNDKAWIRQTIRPVVEDARKQGVNRIELASSDIINNRWQGNAPHDKYQTAYPKILKQYFKDMGVPEKNIHMPTKSSDSFWVELPDDLMKESNPLPQYSIAGSAPMAVNMGEKDDK